MRLEKEYKWRYYKTIDTIWRIQTPPFFFLKGRGGKPLEERVFGETLFQAFDEAKIPYERGPLLRFYCEVDVKRAVSILNDMWKKYLEERL